MGIYVIGDIHGDFKPVRDFYNRALSIRDDDENVLICLGDFGANFFFNHRDWKFKHQLGKFPFTYFVIRGNHEERPSICANKNPEGWHEEEYFGNTVYVENDFPYIKYALDIPSVYNISGYSTLVLPGAYSIDKWYRLAHGWSWFANEQLTPEEIEAGKCLISEYNHTFDLVLSHTCPLAYEPTELFLSFVDQSAVDKTMETAFGEIEFNLDYKLWLFGHYHGTKVYPLIDGHQMLMLFNDKVIELNEWMDILPDGIGGFY